ncbi:MAG: aminoacyl--tRNA ligase-related protein [Candidatus Odinarchaeota archaeon]
MTQISQDKIVEQVLYINSILEKDMDVQYFCDVLSYSSPEIREINCDQKENTIKIVYSGTDEELKALISMVKGKIGKKILHIKNKKIFSHKGNYATNQNDLWSELVAKGLVYDYGNGHIAYNGLINELVIEFDIFFQRLAKKIQATSVQLPNFIPIDKIIRLGLIDEFPHYLFFVAPLLTDVRTIENFQKERINEGSAINKYIINPNYCLKTSACSLLYPTLEGIDFKQKKYFTMLGSCTRRETRDISAFERLTEFQMREIVIIGDNDEIIKFYDFAIDLIKKIITYFDLTANISMGNDSFFVSDYSKLNAMQLLGHTKYEASVLIPNTKKTIAFASFNNHLDFFSKRFKIFYKSSKAKTACLGFGLERLIYGIICRHDLNMKKIMERLYKLYQSYEI